MYQQDWKLYMPKSKMLHWIQIGGSILWRYVKMNLSGKVQRQKKFQALLCISSENVIFHDCFDDQVFWHLLYCVIWSFTVYIQVKQLFQMKSCLPEYSCFSETNFFDLRYWWMCRRSWYMWGAWKMQKQKWKPLLWLSTRL